MGRWYKHHAVEVIELFAMGAVACGKFGECELVKAAAEKLKADLRDKGYQVPFHGEASWAVDQLNVGGPFHKDLTDESIGSRVRRILEMLERKP